jgi:carbonic anhydrase
MAASLQGGPGVKQLAQGALLVAATAALTAAPRASRAPDEGTAMAALLEGNRHFVSDHPEHPHLSMRRAREVAAKQAPEAAVLSCADSRVPPELVFDRGLGDLFVVREAGHAVDDDALASLEYAVEHLGVPLIVVMGHTRCGAVTAAMHGAHEGHIGRLVARIAPSVDDARRQAGGREPTVDEAVRAHVLRTVGLLKASRPILARRVAEGRLRISGAVYDLDSGRVETLVP